VIDLCLLRIGFNSIIDNGMSKECAPFKGAHSLEVAVNVSLRLIAV
jgi:hypothetical protein